MLELLKLRNLPLYYFGWYCWIGAVACLLLLLVSDKQLLGINVWIKPLKFFVSAGIFTWTMALFLGYLNEPYKVNLYNWVVIIVFAFETLYIFIQAGRGQLSHFNNSSPFYNFMFGLMGVAITVMTLWTAYIGYLFVANDFPQLSPSYLWGIRLGIFMFVIFALEGGVMGALNAHTVGAADGGKGLPLLNWSRQHGDLRIAHFLGMHALQLLPLWGYYVAANTRQLLLMALLLFVGCTAVLVQALLGRPLWG